MRIRVFFLICFIKRCADLFKQGRKDTGDLRHLLRLCDHKFPVLGRVIRLIGSSYITIGLHYKDIHRQGHKIRFLTKKRAVVRNQGTELGADFCIVEFRIWHKYFSFQKYHRRVGGRSLIIILPSLSSEQRCFLLYL